MAFRKIITSDRNLQQVQDAVDSALRPLLRSPLSNCVFIKDVSLIAGKDNLIAHGMGNPPLIYIVANQNVQANIWSPTSTQLQNQSANDRWINLNTSSDCVVSLIFSRGL